MSCKRFENKVALITGASSGFGSAIANRLSSEGAKVSLFARRSNLLENLLEGIKEKGGDGIFFKGDVTDGSAVKACVLQTVDQFGKIDILINNAGVELMLPLVMTSEDKWKYNMDVNLGGTIRFIQNTQPIMMKAKSGVIINMASTYGLKGAGGVSIYSMAKGGIIAFTKSLAVELAPRGIRVNAIAPGLVETDLALRTFKNLSVEQIDQIRQMHPLGFGSVDDVASAVAFVASNEAKWMTGSILTIDGGASAK
jgi:NAD(P)-dependent dehydrogenase (short-subunit alcohol dehydrogenase family)